MFEMDLSYLHCNMLCNMLTPGSNENPELTCAEQINEVQSNTQHNCV